MIYIDPLTACVPNGNWRWNQSCHLFADTLDELHTFAKKIGMRREWFQDHKKLPHYDLNVGRRRMAVLNGAQEVDRKFLVEFICGVRKNDDKDSDSPLEC